jgi:hypothetical protein
MQRALLSELQRRSGYPCVTLLVNTTPGEWLDRQQLTTVERFIADADRRLTNDVDDDVRLQVVASLWALRAEAEAITNSEALAICASPTYATVVKLGRPVVERLVIDDTFATRDLVADVHRTATFRVVTVSEHIVRLLYGDRNRLAEQLDERWPLVREEDQSVASWSRAVVHALRAEQRRHSVPTVVAGVERSVQRALGAAELRTVGVVHGNHDRSGWDELHRVTWPLVEGWIEADRMRALERLDGARSQRRFAGGLDEVWALAMEGRLELVVVEDTYAVSARVIDGRLEPTEERESPDVVDDIVDEIVEAVIRHSGGAVIVPDGSLADHDRIAAVARY